MNCYATSYTCDSVKYASHVYAMTLDDACNICQARGLGETIDGTLNDFAPVSTSEMFRNDANPLHILHGVCFMENVAKNLDTLSDRGLLHELLHFYYDKNEPTNLTHAELYDRICALELIMKTQFGYFGENYEHP